MKGKRAAYILFWIYGYVSVTIVSAFSVPTDPRRAHENGRSTAGASITRQAQTPIEAVSMPNKPDLPWFPFFANDWLSSTDIELMSNAEEGAYVRLLCHEWNAPDCGLPNDDFELARLSRLGAKWKKSGPKLRQKFTLRGDRLFNDKLADLWRQAVDKSEAASRAGKKSGESRRARTDVERTLPFRSNGTRTEREPRASESGSGFGFYEVKAEEQQTADGPQEATAGEWANTVMAMRSFFPTLDSAFVIDVCFLCIRENNEVTDEQIAEAVYKTYSTSQKSPGLFRITIPNYIRARKRGVPVKPKSGLDAELERLQAIEKSDKEATNGRR